MSDLINEERMRQALRRVADEISKGDANTKSSLTSSLGGRIGTNETNITGLKNRLEDIAPLFSPNYYAYKAGEYVWYNNSLYCRIEDADSLEEWDATKWRLVPNFSKEIIEQLSTEVATAEEVAQFISA